MKKSVHSSRTFVRVLMLTIAASWICSCSNSVTAGFTSATTTVAESNTTVTVDFFINRKKKGKDLEPGSGGQAEDGDVLVTYTLSGNAVNPADYVLSEGTVTIPSGSTTASISFPIYQDALDEYDETIVLTISDVTNATFGENLVHTITISDDDPTPTVTLTSAGISVAETVGALTITGQLDAVSGRDVTLPYTVSGTASYPADHNLQNGSITILEGNTTGSLSFTPVADVDVESTETVILTLTDPPTNATISGISVWTLDLYDAPAADFSTSTQSIAENGGTVTITVNTSVLSGVNVTIPFTVGGTSGAQDHDLVAGSIVVPAYALTASTTFTVTNDILDEVDETAIVTMGTVLNGIAGTTNVQTITITDNDPLAIANFSAATQTIGAETGVVTVTATLDLVSSKNITLPFTVSGTAGIGVDHDLTNGSIVIAAGNLSGTTTFNVTTDTIDEANETVILTFGSPTNASLGGTTTHTVTITDDDPIPTADFTASTQSVSESVGIVTISASLSNASQSTVTIPFTVGGTATNPADHNLSNGSITVVPYATSGSTTFTVVNESVDENNETVVVTMGSPTNAVAGTTTVKIITILNDDKTVNWSAASQSVSEAAGTASFTASIASVSSLNITVPYTVSGTSGGSDHDLAAGSLTITAGTTSATKNFNITSDAIDENDETVIVTMGSLTNGTQGGTTVHTVTITDDDAPPTVSFSASTQSVSEAVGTVTITASLSAVSGLTVTAPYTVTGTAANPSDHNLADGNITVTAGSASGTTNFAVVSDTKTEANETVIVTMGSPTNATQGATTVQTITMNNDDANPTANFSASTQSVAESIGLVTVQVNLDRLSDFAITVPYTVSGTAVNPDDHDFANGNISIPTDNLSGTTTFTVAEDALDENDETVISTMGVPTNASAGATTVQTVTVTDNDPLPTANFTASSQSLGESAGAVTFTAQIDAVSGRNVTVPYTVSGTATNPADHDLANSSIVITAGGTTNNANFNIAVDSLDEDHETVIATMGALTNASSGGTTTHTLTITDDDAPPSVEFTASGQTVAETVGGVTLTAQLSAVSGRTVTVPYTVSGTAVQPDDHDLADASIVISAGDSSEDLDFTVVNDGDTEISETVISTIGVPTNASVGATSAHTVTITDDDRFKADRGLIAWFDANEGVIRNLSGKVTRWVDSSQNETALSAASSELSPEFIAKNRKQLPKLLFGKRVALLRGPQSLLPRSIVPSLFVVHSRLSDQNYQLTVTGPSEIFSSLVGPGPWLRTLAKENSDSNVGTRTAQCALISKRSPVDFSSLLEDTLQVGALNPAWTGTVSEIVLIDDSFSASLRAEMMKHLMEKYKIQPELCRGALK